MTEARCVETDCRGVAVSQGRCVGHVDEDGLASYVAELLPHGMWDARGATIDETRCLQLVELLASAEFTGDTNFSGALFTGGDAIFAQAQFSGGDVYFSGAQFTGGAVNFTEAQFTGGNALPSAARSSLAGTSTSGTRSSAGTPSSPERSSAGLVSSAHFVAPLWTCGARFRGRRHGTRRLFDNLS